MAATKPALEELLTTAGIGRFLGVTRSGAHYIARRAPGFPEPIGKLGHYIVWWQAEVAAWATTSRRSRALRVGEVSAAGAGKPDLGQLWTTTDIARAIGEQRTSARPLLELVGEPDFPAPIGQLGNYLLWWRAEVEPWLGRAVLPRAA